MQAHILVCFLAFVLPKSLEVWQSRAGLGTSPAPYSKSSHEFSRTTSTASASSFQSACASPKDELPALAASD